MINLDAYFDMLKCILNGKKEWEKGLCLMMKSRVNFVSLAPVDLEYLAKQRVNYIDFNRIHLRLFFFLILLALEYYLIVIN